jgi:hypothetical protein
MLSIGRLGSGQETYYLEKVAEGAEDYYTAKLKQNLSSRRIPTPRQGLQWEGPMQLPLRDRLRTPRTADDRDGRDLRRGP